MRRVSSQKKTPDKRYQINITEKPKNTEKVYELTIRSQSLEKFMPEDQEMFRNMESDLTGLEDELNRL